MIEATTPLLIDAYTSSSALVLDALSAIPAPTTSLTFDVLFGLGKLLVVSSVPKPNSSSRAITEFVTDAELDVESDGFEEGESLLDDVIDIGISVIVANDDSVLL